MSEFSVQREQMMSLIQEMGVLSKQLHQLTDGLDTELRSTLQTWTSETKEAYQVSKKKWDAAAERMPLALQNAAQRLDEILNAYNQTEVAGTRTFGG